MSNQVILWLTILLPWTTLLFMEKEYIKRYMPVALFGSVLVTAFSELALAMNWWVIKDAIFPFYHVAPMAFGAFPVGILWIFRLTYKNFILYLVANAIIDFALIFIFDAWLARRGILELTGITPLRLFLMDIANAVVLYGYQLWQNDVFEVSEQVMSSAEMNPALKPLDRIESERKK